MTATLGFPPAPVKPNRHVRLKCWNASTGTGVLEISDKGKTDTYAIESAESEIGGQAWHMLKISEVGCDVYGVLLADDGFHQCGCMAHSRWQTCRHVSALLALRQRGKI